MPLRGGSIVNTILNGPSYITQKGGEPSDIRRIESILNEEVRLYSNGLRSELMQLQAQLEQSGKKMPDADFNTLRSAIDDIARRERDVLQATLAGHQFLEAHKNYEMTGDIANLNATLENLQKIVLLVEQKSSKLVARQQRVAQTMNLVVASLPTLRLSAMPRL